MPPIAACSARPAANIARCLGSRTAVNLLNGFGNGVIAVKVTLRNRETGEFLNEGGSWVASGLQAHDFCEAALAEERRTQLGIPEVDIFYIFDDSQLNHWA